MRKDSFCLTVLVDSYPIISRFVYMLFLMDMKDANIIVRVTYIVNRALYFLSSPLIMLCSAKHLS